MGNLSRRGFVASAIPVVAAAAGSSPVLGLAQEPAWSLEADVVVVGLGGAGCAAALAAIEAGASVIVLEGESSAGGTTALCGGLIYCGGGTQTQIDAGVEDTVDDMRAYLLAALGPSADPKLVETYCQNSLDNYQWLVDNGVTFDGGYDLESHCIVAPEGVVLIYSGNERAVEYASIAKPAPRGHTPNGGGAGIIAALMDKIEASGKAEILYETHATDLIKDESGAVVGVKAVADDGAELSVKGNGGVILTTGSFIYNDVLVSNYAPEAALCAGRTGGPWDRGDGIVMGMRAGAATRSMSRLMLSEFLYQHGDMASGLLVNRNGLRFLAEDWYGSWVGRRVMQETPEACYLVVDDAIMQGIAQGYARKMPDPCVVSDSLEELVEQLDVPSQSLLDSIARYNAFVAEGEDKDFHKSIEYMKPIATPPFYAYDARPGNMAFSLTLGGLRINENGEVLDLEESPIPGLYAAGRTSCGIYGEYPGSGSSVFDAITFGRIAGTLAADRA